MIFSKTLSNYVFYLHNLFSFLNIKKTTFSFKKSFLKFLIIILLNQKINVFEFIAIIKKIIAIQRLKFSYELIDLKLYLRFTN